MSLKDISAALAQVTSQVLQDSQERMKVGIAEEALKYYDKNGQWPKMVVWENKIRDVKFTLDEAKELTDKQKKIAKVAGHPGKIDAADFAALRAGHKVKEEVELSVDEQTEDDSVFDLVDGEAEYELKEGVELQEGKVVHGVHTIYTGAVVKGMPEGNPTHVDAAHLGRTKALGVPTEKGEKYGKTVRVVVKNNETGETTHHHVYQRDFQDSKRPVISIRDVGAAREKQAEHFKALHDYLSGKKPTTKYSGKMSEEVDLGEEKDTPGQEHMCAVHVKHSKLGEGRTVTTQHADPDADGNIAWYDVMFEHGIEKQVPTSDLEILFAESHMHGKRKMKEDVDQIDEISKATAKSYVDKKMENIYAMKKAPSKDKTKKDIDSLQRAHERIVGNKPTSEEVDLIDDEAIEEGMQQTLRKYVPGYAKKQIDKKMDDQKFGRTDVDKDANFYRYKKIQDKLKKEEVDLIDEVEVIEEGVTVKKQNYSWGKMVTVHKGADTSYPLHPEHQAAIKRLRPSGEHSKTSFKDETGRMVHATREGDKVHLVSHGANSDKTTVAYKHFDEAVEYVDEGRGRPRKNPDDPKWKKQNQAKPIKTSKHDDDDEEDYGPDTGPEPDQNIINQLKRAHDARSMKGHADVKFADNKVHSVPSHVAKAVLDGLDKLKPSDRLNVQQHIHQSHKNLMAVHKLISKA